MQYASQLPPSSSSVHLAHSISSDEQDHQAIDQRISLFVVEISRTLNLTAEQRDSLQVLANFSSNLPQEILVLNVLHIQATIFKLENKMNSLEQKFVDTLNQVQVSKQVITGEQRATMHATVKEYLVQSDRIQWDVASEVMDDIKVKQEFESVFANPKMKKDLLKEIRKFATEYHNVLRINICNSVGSTTGRPELKAFLTKTVDEIARRFLDIPAARASPEFFIFVALLRHIARETPTLINRSEVGPPQKGKDWWAGVAAWFQEKTELWGNNKNTGEWLKYVLFHFQIHRNEIIDDLSVSSKPSSDERKHHPEDPIACLPSAPSIPVNQGVPPATSANAEYMESRPTSVDHMGHAPDASYAAGYSPFQYFIQEGQASGSSSIQIQYPDPHASGPSQYSVYSSHIPYQWNGSFNYDY
ncbi:hypothetical protein M422DRAFT_246166 [Sphaerobolus stellatus SS14]|nr:hypothetical protein M422DRAFT_246166 [Sphaerobolus stellatus SS14]